MTTGKRLPISDRLHRIFLMSARLWGLWGFALCSVLLMQLPLLGSSRRTMLRMMAIPLPILLTLILLPPIAFASPPDPSWIVGFYDGADGDDVVNLVYESSASNSAAPSHTRPLPWLLVSLQ